MPTNRIAILPDSRMATMIYARKYPSLSRYIEWASLLLVSLCFAAAASANTVRTASNYSELIQAITDSAASGDEIRLTGNIVVNTAVLIDKSLTIDGDGFEITVPQPGLDAMGRFNSDASNFRVFTLNTASTNVILKNLNLKGGAITSGDGGAVLVGSGVTLTIENAQIEQSRASFGGGGAIASNSATGNVEFGDSDSTGGATGINGGDVYVVI